MVESEPRHMHGSVNVGSGTGHRSHSELEVFCREFGIDV